MHKRYLTLFIILLPIVYAEELFSGTVDDGAYFQAGEYNSTIKYSKGNDKAVLTVGEITRILEVGECFEEQGIKGCFDSATLDDNGYATSITVTVSTLGPSIVLTRTFSETAVSIGQYIDVTVTLTNEGEQSARDVTFRDAYPSTFQVSGSQGNTITWSGRITPGDSEHISYKLLALSETEFTSKATATYTASDKLKTVTDSEELSIEKPYSFTATLLPKSPKKAQKATYNLTIDNSEGEDPIKVSNLVIETSSQVEILSSSAELKKDGTHLTYTGTIDKGAHKSLQVQVSSNRVGEHFVATNATIQIGTQRYEESLLSKFGIGITKITPLINISPGNPKSGDDIKVVVYLENTGDEEISGIDAKIDSSLFSEEIINEKVAKGKKEEVLKKTLLAPDVESKTTYTIQIIGSYTKDQTFTFKASSDVTVHPTEKLLELLHELDKENYDPGDSVTIDVQLINLQSTSLDKVSLIEILPNEVKSTLQGTITDDIPIGASEKKKAYSYSFTIPQDYSKSTLIIKTIVNTNFEGSLYKYQIEKQISIAGIEEQNETSEEVPEEVGDEAQAEEPSQESFFTKIINFFKNLFKSKSTNQTQPVEPE